MEETAVEFEDTDNKIKMDFIDMKFKAAISAHVECSFLWNPQINVFNTAHSTILSFYWDIIQTCRRSSVRMTATTADVVKQDTEVC